MLVLCELDLVDTVFSALPTVTSTSPIKKAKTNKIMPRSQNVECFTNIIERIFDLFLIFNHL